MNPHAARTAAFETAASAIPPLGPSRGGTRLACPPATRYSLTPEFRHAGPMPRTQVAREGLSHARWAQPSESCVSACSTTWLFLRQGQGSRRGGRARSSFRSTPPRSRRLPISKTANTVERFVFGGSQLPNALQPVSWAGFEPAISGLKGRRPLRRHHQDICNLAKCVGQELNLHSKLRVGYSHLGSPMPSRRLVP